MLMLMLMLMLLLALPSLLPVDSTAAVVSGSVAAGTKPGSLRNTDVNGYHTSSGSASCSDPAENITCLWYPDCLEQAHPCGADGYALGYGFKYCQLFASANSSQLSPAGLLWRNETLLCLQRALVPLLSNATVTCAEILDFAYQTHPICYTESGLCKLSLKDLEAIREIVCQHTVTCDGQVWQGRFWEQIWQVVKDCA